MVLGSYRNLESKVSTQTESEEGSDRGPQDLDSQKPEYIGRVQELLPPDQRRGKPENR